MPARSPAIADRHRTGHRLRALVLLLPLAFTLSACVTPIPPVEVTRFHRAEAGATLGPGFYSFDDDTEVDFSRRVAPEYRAAVARQLELLGLRSALTIATAPPADQPSYRVAVRVDRSVRTAAADGSGVNVGVGGSTGSYGSGVGVGVGVNLNSLLGGGPRDMVETTLSVRLIRAGEALPLWEGRAQTLAREGTPAAQPGLDADKLASALFAGFPGTSGATITVP